MRDITDGEVKVIRMLKDKGDITGYCDGKDEGDVVIVTASVLNVRDEPAGKKVHILVRGKKVTIIDREGDWLHLAANDGGGWIHRDYVKEDEPERERGITLHQLKEIMPHSKESDREEFIEPLNETMKRYEITSPLRQAHFLSQLAHESGSFRYTKEIASGSAYEGRKDLGNTQPGDGKRFKGRGLIQLTGRFNYQEYGNFINVNLLSNPERVSEDHYLAVDVAGWYWMKRGLNKLADNDDVKRITKRINGGYNGLGDRVKYLEQAKKVLIPIKITPF